MRTIQAHAVRYVPPDGLVLSKERLKRSWTNCMIAFANNDRFMFGTFLAESMHHCKTLIDFRNEQPNQHGHLGEEVDRGDDDTKVTREREAN